MSDMGIADGFRQQPRKGQAIVAFDFDGTLTVRDSFTAFLRWRAGRRGWALGLVKLAPAVAVYAKDRDRGRIKAASASASASVSNLNQVAPPGASHTYRMASNIAHEAERIMERAARRCAKARSVVHRARLHSTLRSV